MPGVLSSEVLVSYLVAFLPSSWLCQGEKPKKTKGLRRIRGPDKLKMSGLPL